LIERRLAPTGPYSLAFSARLSSDATRTFRDGLLTAAIDGEIARAWQSPDGTVTVRAASEQGVERLRWILALDDDHSEFLRSVRHDAMLGPASRALRGLRPMRLGTVAQALLRAFCGQLIEAKRARRMEQTIIRRFCPPVADGLHTAPTTAELAALAPSQLRALGLHTRRAAALVRLCRSIELERLHDVPTDVVAARLDRERGLGPWSIGVVCLEGLGRHDYGLVGDLGLVKLLRELRGREVEGWETAELLEPYGEWKGLASMYLLAGYARGLLPVATARAA
jgi:AraC family transcriptional regulator of adaptative response / DNA-3-methyladenine glycosylase II